jgi:acyl-CoA thioester hydrolase
MKDFYIEKKIYYHDTDCGGVVYYANYLKYLEEGRSEFCASFGVDLKPLADSGTYFVVARTEIDYKAPARYQDKLKVYTKIDKVGNASIYFSQLITKDDVNLIEAKTIWVCVGKDFKTKPTPKEIKEIFSARQSEKNAR